MTAEGIGKGGKCAGSRAVRQLVLLCAVVMAFSLCLPATAHAYLVRDPVYVGLSQDYVQLQVGQSATLSCVVDPMSEDQLPGCFEAYCPEGCGGDMGCLDANGWCTCAGGGYVRYNTNVFVLSSDPSIARASWEGGVLYVNARESPGTAVITMTASLRNHQPDVTQSVTVVVDALPEQAGAEDEYVGDGDGEGAADGQGEAGTNVTNGTGDADNANLSARADASGEAGYDKPAASEDADGATETPQVPEAPVQPDVSNPVVLYELEEVEEQGEHDAAPIDMAYAGGTVATGALCIGFGVLRHAEYRRRQLQ